MNDTRKNDKRHLKVVGTTLRSNELKRELVALLGEVPLSFEFDNPGGEALLSYVDDKVKEGVPIEKIAEEIGLGEEFVTVYEDWSAGRE